MRKHMQINFCGSLFDEAPADGKQISVTVLIQVESTYCLLVLLVRLAALHLIQWLKWVCYLVTEMSVMLYDCSPGEQNFGDTVEVPAGCSHAAWRKRDVRFCELCGVSWQLIVRLEDQPISQAGAWDIHGDTETADDLERRAVKNYVRDWLTVSVIRPLHYNWTHVCTSNQY